MRRPGATRSTRPTRWPLWGSGPDDLAAEPARIVRHRAGLHRPAGARGRPGPVPPDITRLRRSASGIFVVAWDAGDVDGPGAHVRRRPRHSPRTRRPGRPRRRTACGWRCPGWSRRTARPATRSSRASRWVARRCCPAGSTSPAGVPTRVRLAGAVSRSPRAASPSPDLRGSALTECGQSFGRRRERRPMTRGRRRRVVADVSTGVGAPVGRVVRPRRLHRVTVRLEPGDQRARRPPRRLGLAVGRALPGGVQRGDGASRTPRVPGSSATTRAGTVTSSAPLSWLRSTSST